MGVPLTHEWRIIFSVPYPYHPYNWISDTELDFILFFSGFQDANSNCEAQKLTDPEHL